MNTPLTSTSFPNGAQCDKSESEVRAIRARRNLMEADLRAEGAPESFIEKVATDETAAKMLVNEQRITGLVYSMFGTELK